MSLLDPVAADLEGPTAPSDAELIHAVRAGDRHAYGVLYERHLAAARAHARQLTRSSADADDLVSEGFAKVFAVLRAGHGPDRAFRAYLLTTLRNGLYQRMRQDRRLQLSDDMAQHDPGIPWSDPVEAELNSSLAARAFSTLPERWQTVLWQSEVERHSTAEIAERLGLRPNAVAALAYRAREGLRQAYLQAHLTEYPDESCRPTVHRLGGWTRGRLSRADAALVQAHLDGCDPCRKLAAELADVNSGIRGLFAPLAVAGTTAGYASSALGIDSVGVVAGAAVGAGAVPASAATGAASSGSMIGSALGWLLGTQVGQATAAALTAVVVGGTAVAAGTGVVGPGGREPAPAAAAAPASTHRTTSDTAAVRVDRSAPRRPVALARGTESKGKEAVGKPSQAKRVNDNRAPAKAVGKASYGKPAKQEPSPARETKKSSTATASSSSPGQSAPVGSPQDEAATSGAQTKPTAATSIDANASTAKSARVRPGPVHAAKDSDAATASTSRSAGLDQPGPRVGQAARQTGKP
jgi:RNA polymerase sigma factor (sigma-70 family)